MIIIKRNSENTIKTNIEGRAIAPLLLVVKSSETNKVRTTVIQADFNERFCTFKVVEGDTESESTEDGKIKLKASTYTYEIKSENEILKTGILTVEG